MPIMTYIEINTFIEHFEAYGDNWTPKQVSDIYGDKTLEEAISSRTEDLETYCDIWSKIINR